MLLIRILQGESKAKSRTTVVVSRKADFGLFRICLEESHAIYGSGAKRHSREFHDIQA